jgi:hypothetical protein
MNATRMAKLVTLVSVVAVAGGTASAQPPREKSSDNYAYVFVTGSNIPQRVKIKRIGSLTTSPITAYDRDDIHKTGRFTTEEVLRQDPSLKVHGFGQAGPSD